MEPIRKFACFLLAVCFFLPLSTCNGGTTREGRARPDTTLYAFDIAKQGAADVQQGKWEGAKRLLVVLVVFFVPLIGLAFSDKIQAVVNAACSFVAAYCLFFWVYFFSTGVEAGGSLATICWTVLLVASCVRLRRMFASPPE